MTRFLLFSIFNLFLFSLCNTSRSLVKAKRQPFIMLSLTIFDVVLIFIFLALFSFLAISILYGSQIKDRFFKVNVSQTLSSCNINLSEFNYALNDQPLFLPLQYPAVVKLLEKVQLISIPTDLRNIINDCCFIRADVVNEAQKGYESTQLQPDRTKKLLDSQLYQTIFEYQYGQANLDIKHKDAHKSIYKLAIKLVKIKNIICYIDKNYKIPDPTAPVLIWGHLISKNSVNLNVVLCPIDLPKYRARLT